ncbi:FkbM family methyltransferase [Halomicrobium katesii]|uniref:FkbM family methyltransferase n=1 Tax=Halomicrobium katesii TaxID=437163 RepID=UPI0012BA850C|nr:FkbM family methyltransferase [Halomicrobium katesii]
MDNSMVGRVLRGYESTEVRFVQQYLPQQTPVVELGGGIGYVSCIIDGELPPETRQYVFEANPDAIPLLATNRDLNGSGFEIRNLAYDPDRDRVEFFPAQTLTGGSTRIEHGEPTMVDAASLADVVDMFGLDRFVLVSDIEEAETDMMKLEQDVLAQHCELMIIEWHDETRFLHDALAGTPFTEVDRESGVHVLRNRSLS